MAVICSSNGLYGIMTSTIVLFFLLNVFGVKCQSSTTSDYTSYTTPTVNLSSCVNQVAVFKITNLKSGGLIYLRTVTGIHKLEESFDTNGDVYTYQCSFAECGIEWFIKFTFVSQRHAVIQTSYDLHQTFICLADLLSITPGGGSTNEETAEDVLQHRYRASAAMRFYNSEGTELESGSFVKLGAQIQIYINLTNNIGDMFDLSVKSCSALLLPLISDRCPSDDVLFSDFTKLSVGLLFNNFSMFRPTTTVSGAMDVLFSCTLEICRNPCSSYYCNGTEAVLISQNSTSRRRKRQTQSRSLKLGTIFRVDYEEPVVEEPEEKCMGITPVAVFTSLGVVLSASLVLMLYYITEWHRECQSVNESTKIPPDKSMEKISIPKELVKTEIVVCPSRLLFDNDSCTEKSNININANIDEGKTNPTNKLKSCLKMKPQSLTKSKESEMTACIQKEMNICPISTNTFHNSQNLELGAQDKVVIESPKTNGSVVVDCSGLVKHNTLTNHNGSVKLDYSGSANPNTPTRHNGSVKAANKSSAIPNTQIRHNGSVKLDYSGSVDSNISTRHNGSVKSANKSLANPNTASRHNGSVKLDYSGLANPITPTKHNGSVKAANASSANPNTQTRHNGSVKLDYSGPANQKSPTIPNGSVKLGYSGSANQNTPTRHNGSVKLNNSDSVNENTPTCSNGPVKLNNSDSVNENNPTISNVSVKIGNSGLANTNTLTRPSRSVKGDKLSSDTSNTSIRLNGPLKGNYSELVNQNPPTTANKPIKCENTGLENQNPPIIHNGTVKSDCSSANNLSKPNLEERGQLHHNSSAPRTETRIDGVLNQLGSKPHEYPSKQHIQKAVYSTDNSSLRNTSNNGILYKKDRNSATLKRSMSQAIAREIITLRARSSSSPKQDYVGHTN